MKNNQIIYIILIIVIIILLGVILYFSITQYKCTIENKDNERYNNSKEDYENNKEVIVSTINYPTADIQRDPKTLNSLDRIYNPLRYPYKSDDYYDQGWYPNLQLPFQVIGCGSRTQPCLGGTQVPIYNPPVPIDISDNNIAPVYISTRGPLGKPQQVGIIYKINGNDNEVLPLYGRRKYPNDNKYEYYTQMGRFGVKVPVITRNRNDELGTNDVIFIKGMKDAYRVTIYESDMPQYIPYL
jgi:heme/copper-type cytochrome/quinol oxidase subunit 2